MTYSRTLGQALKRLARYGHIMSEGVDMKLAEEERQVLFAFEGVPRLDSLRHPVVARLVAILGVAREITGTPLKPLEVHFPYARPVETSRIATYFGCPLVYDKPVSGLVLGRRELELPIRTADETLAGYLDRLAEEVLQSLDSERRFSVTVRRAIWRELSGGQPSMGRIADLLHVSLRTLQRRLQQEGLTFAGVREALRREVAEVLLRNPDLAVYEVAFLLGYSEPSTFYRAFRRWHRISPRELRSSA
jgi:AraC-like DNA-binding protein